MENKQQPSVAAPKAFGFLCAFVFYNFSLNVIYSYFFNVALPLDLIELVGEDAKTKTLGIIMAVTVLISMVLAPLFGLLSDKLCDNPLGRRRPVIFVASVACLACFMLRTNILKPQFFFVYSIVALMIRLGLAVGETTYMAMMVEVFPKAQLPTASAINGFTSALGIAVGAVIGFLYGRLYPFILNGIIAGIFWLGILVLMMFREPTRRELNKRKDVEEAMEHDKAAEAAAQASKSPIVSSPEYYTSSTATNFERFEDTVAFTEPENGVAVEQNSLNSVNSSSTQHAKGIKGVFASLLHTIYSFIKPFTHWDFFWMFISRCLATFGSTGPLSYYLYFIRDCIGPNYVFLFWGGLLKEAQEVHAIQQIINTSVALPVALFSGKISEFLGSKLCMIVSGTVMSLSFVGKVIFPSLNTLLLFQVFTAIGLGLYFGVSVSYTTEVLPNKAEAGKDLAIFQLAQTVPQVLATPFSAFLIDYGNSLSKRRAVNWPYFGHFLNFGAGAIVTLISVLLTFCVRKGSPKKMKRPPARAKSPSLVTSFVEKE